MVCELCMDNAGKLEMTKIENPWIKNATILQTTESRTGFILQKLLSSMLATAIAVPSLIFASTHLSPAQAAVIPAAPYPTTVDLYSTAADTQTFILGGDDNFGSDPAAVKLTLEDLGHDLKFMLDVQPEASSSNIADLRGFFFNIADESLLPGLSVTALSPNPDIITKTKFRANDVINLGGGVNLNGNGSLRFDAGLAFGTPGIGKDDVRSVAFKLTHADSAVNLGLDLLHNQYVGARLTSTGPEGSSRNGSSKLKKKLLAIAEQQDSARAKVPELTSIASLFFVLGGLLICRRPKLCSRSQ